LAILNWPSGKMAEEGQSDNRVPEMHCGCASSDPL
jgi:hypothetical protein